VVTSAAGVVDEAATTALRARITAERGDLPMFNRGPDIETLRETCLAETGLPPPTQPKWRTAA
jgi:N-methylhydantoinase B